MNFHTVYKTVFRYCEQQILSRISSSIFRILFSSESSNYLRVEEKSQLFCWLIHKVCEEHITDVFTSLSRECCKCPLRTAVLPQNTEQRMIFIPWTAEPTNTVLPVQRVRNMFHVLHILVKPHLSWTTALK